ncbi:peptidylprolyl isomerase [Paracoccus sp. M683]|uniref:peptidylprolyl isomerase n=1 Tax=Paracoccus sp. M683 TaxID=2594268 RepID=UPI00117EA4F5|nr:peptidylprolyl isomerase [Paracoccus sp. M683]TRW98126.1 peptidylprolyl isomerase [Paracoccus sp. M683]
MRQFLSGLTLAAILMTAAPAMAQNPFEAVVYVNGSAVTRYEIDQRIRFMQLLNAPGASPEAAEKALIEDRLRMQAARNLGITVSEEALDAGLSEFAGRANLDTLSFIDALGQAGVERQVFRDFVEAGVAWRDVIRQQILPGVQVRDPEIDQALKREIETPIVTRVLVSELIIPAPEGQEEAAMAAARQVIASVTDEASFASAARRLSATPSAPRGGRLDWMNVENMPPSLRPILLALRPGQVTQPLTVPGAVVLFFLRDTQGTLRPGASEQVLDYATLRVPTAQDAANIVARVDTCADLEAQGRGNTLRQSQSQNAIPALLATQLASLDADETAMINMGGAVDVLMLCSRQPALLAAAQADIPVTAEEPDGVEAAVPDPNALPDRQVVREALLNQKINAMANAYLAELYADAVIRRP